MAQATQSFQGAQNAGSDVFRGLGQFQKNKPPTFKERYDLEDARIQIREIQRIIKVMTCPDGQKISFRTHMLASLKIESKAAIEDLHVMCVFSEVFPKDIYSSPPEREIEFLIYLILGTILISMAPYKMSTSKLSDLMKQL